MLLIFPEKYEFETALAPKKFARKINSDMFEYRPTLNFMAKSKFMKAHRNQDIYYGRIEDNKFQIFFHKAGKRDGGETGYFGTFEKDGDKTKITGSFRKPVSAYVFGILWTVVTLFISLICVSLKEYLGAFVIFSVFAIGLGMLFWDNGKKKILMKYFEKYIGDDDYC